MKTLIFALISPVLVLAASNTNRATLLECNMYGGDYQEVRVYQEGNSGKYTLYTLNTSGYVEERSLPKAQWLKQKISIPCRHRQNQTCGYISKFQDSWFYSVGDSGWKDSGFCN